MTVRHSYESADGYYALGRYYHGAQRHDDARKAYLQALSLDPTYAKAANALAILYAETGDLRQSADLLKKLTQAGPEASHLFSNLGHVYFMDGRYEEARQALEKATALDPGNVRAWNNLGSVLEKLGEDEHARSVFTRARAGTPGSPAKVVNKEDDNSRHGTRVQALGGGVYEVRPMQALSGFNAAPAVATSLPASARMSPARVEVSNGNGVTGMAKAVSRMIHGRELKVMRITNQSRFIEPVTRIEYNDGYEQAARGLASRIGPSVVTASGSVGPAVDVRIVLGKDLRDARTVGAHYLAHGASAQLVEARAN